MKILMAYTLIVLGLPILSGLLIGGLAGALIGVPLSWCFPAEKRAREFSIYYLDVFFGAGAALAAILLFKAVGAGASIAGALIIIAEMTVYFVNYPSLKGWLAWLVGFGVCWLALAGRLTS